MTFVELAGRLGVARARVNTHPSGSYFRLPWLPLDRFKEFEGAVFGGRFQGREVIQIPVDEGLALVAGTVRLEEDGSQTVVDAIVVLKDE